jgi:hypothetical protein
MVTLSAQALAEITQAPWAAINASWGGQARLSIGPAALLGVAALRHFVPSSGLGAAAHPVASLPLGE